MKKRKIILGIVIPGLIVLGLIKDQAIKTVVSAGITKVMGTPVEIRRFSLGILNQSVRIKGLRLYNPPDFPREVLLDLPEIRVDYSLPSLLKGRLYLPFLAINLKELTVIKNENGRLNIDGLKLKQDKAMPMQIDSLSLNIGRVTYKDYSQGNKPLVEVLEVDIKNKTFKDITTAQQLAILMIVEALKPTAIKNAGIYGAAFLFGRKFLPSALRGLLSSKDHVVAEFKASYDRVYKACLETAQRTGRVIKEDKRLGEIKANIEASGVTMTVSRTFEEKVQVMIKASQYLIPRADVAGRILKKISERLK